LTNTKGVIIKNTDKKIDLDKLDKKMQKEGWKFLGPIIHYKKALKNQAMIYEKNEKCIVFGIDHTGKNILKEPISKKEAEKRVKESVIEISKHMLRESI
jgi:hypothetical protein